MFFEKILKKFAKKLKNGAKMLEVILKKQKKRRGGLSFALSTFLPLGHRF